MAASDEFMERVPRAPVLVERMPDVLPLAMALVAAEKRLLPETVVSPPM